MFKKILISISLFVYPIVLSAFDTTYYSDVFEGNLTSRGTVFSQKNHSAAVCTQELGQLAYVSRGNTGMMIVLDDRPDCLRFPDLLDLSRSVFSLFASPESGEMSDVSMIPTGVHVGNFSKSNISQKDFESLGVELKSEIANTYFSSEILRLSGKVRTGQKYVMTYFENKDTGKKFSKAYPVNTSGIFDILVNIPSTVGEYYFIIAAGTSFHAENPPSLRIFPTDIFRYDSGGSYSKDKLINISTKPTALGDTRGVFLPSGIWGELRLDMYDSSLSFSGKNMVFDGEILKKGKASYIFTGYLLSSPSSLDRSLVPIFSSKGSMILDRIHDSIGADRVRVIAQGKNIMFRFQTPIDKKIKADFYVTLPSGDVRIFSFDTKYIDVSGFLKSGIQIQASFPVDIQGTYMLETLDQEGFAYFNIPVNRGNVWNTVEELSDANIRNIKISPIDVKNRAYQRINTLRTILGRGLIERDNLLDTLAQKKAENMAKYVYVGHVTPDGKDIRSFALSERISIAGTLGENVAGGNVSGAALQDGLEESGSHRANMIDPGWKKVGIGYTVKDGKTYMVQVFSD